MEFPEFYILLSCMTQFDNSTFAVIKLIKKDGVNKVREVIYLDNIVDEV